jgi:hypothetical protein
MMHLELWVKRYKTMIISSRHRIQKSLIESVIRIVCTYQQPK